MQKNDHFSVARLEERVLYIVVDDIDLVTTNRRETETYQQQQRQQYHHLVTINYTHGVGKMFKSVCLSGAELKNE